jgi:hypothetical protein
VREDWAKLGGPTPPVVKAELPRCTEPGCQNEAAPIWGGLCQSHYAQRPKVPTAVVPRRAA